MIELKHTAKDLLFKKALFIKRAGAICLDLFILYYVIAVLIFNGNFMIFLSISIIYFTLMPITKLQGTIGKMFFGIKITDLEGEKIILKISILRFASQIFYAMVIFTFAVYFYDYWENNNLILLIWPTLFFLWYASALFGKDRKAMHDIMYRTQVVEIKENKEVSPDVKNFLISAIKVIFVIFISIIAAYTCAKTYENQRKDSYRKYLEKEGDKSLEEIDRLVEEMVVD